MILRRSVGDALLTHARDVVAETPPRIDYDRHPSGTRRLHVECCPAPRTWFAPGGSARRALWRSSWLSTGLPSARQFEASTEAGTRHAAWTSVPLCVQTAIRPSARMSKWSQSPGVSSEFGLCSGGVESGTGVAGLYWWGCVRMRMSFARSRGADRLTPRRCSRIMSAPGAA